MPIRRRWCGARPLVSCCNYPAVRCLLLVRSLVLTAPFVTWVYLLTTTSVRLLTFGELCHAVSPHSASFATFVDTSPTTVSVPWWCRLCTQDSTTPTLSWSGFQLRSSSSHQLLVPPFRLTTVVRRTFPVAASLLWNSLPSDIQSSPSLPVFRQRLQTFFFPYTVLWSTAPSWTSW